MREGGVLEGGEGGDEDDEKGRRELKWRKISRKKANKWMNKTINK